MTLEIGACERTRWVAVHAHPGREHSAANNLRDQGYESYVPVIRKQVRHARVTRDVLRPLFPSYLFVRFHPEMQRWRPILSTVGVRSVVCTGDEPCAVPDSFILQLKAREENGVIVRSAAARHIGDTVRIAHGALDGVAGEIIGLPENDRLIVLMDILNRPVRVTISASHLGVA